MSAIYNYPQTSCRCYNCDNNKTTLKGIPSNMSIPNCDFKNFNECYTSKNFRNNIEPAQKSGYTYLNFKNLSPAVSKEFTKIECPDNQGGCKTVYASMDPRLINVPHAQSLTLDRPPQDESMLLSQIYGEELRNYGKGYRTYADIKEGQYQYYIDKSREDPFYSPLFATSANVNGSVYKDPMGALKPSYERTPLISIDYLNTKNNNYTGCLSWIRDSTEQREDILSKQMYKINQQRYEPRWTS
jgi:hypothetical protein